MKPDAADRELAAMRAVLATLLDIERKEAEARAFFGEAECGGL